jgi:hypothetical protein
MKTNLDILELAVLDLANEKVSLMEDFTIPA